MLENKCAAFDFGANINIYMERYTLEKPETHWAKPNLINVGESGIYAHEQQQQQTDVCCVCVCVGFGITKRAEKRVTDRTFGCTTFVA